MANGSMSDALRRERVVIFGAGVTGLSAAHELAERGFEVEVIEECPHPLRAGDCQVGGMARTQWSRFATGEPVDELARPGMRRARPLLCLDWLFNPTLDDKESDAKRGLRCTDPAGGAEKAELYFQKDSDTLDGTARARLDAIAKRLRAYVADHVRTETVVLDWEKGDPQRSDPPTPEILCVEGYCAPDERPGAARRRAEVVATALRPLLGDTVDLLQVQADGFDCAPDEDPGRSDDRKRCVGFRLREVILPGEHGYRFFPSFYRHLFDVMDRTPILQQEQVTPQEHFRRLSRAQRARSHRQDVSRRKFVETGRTVHDNLLTTKYHSIEQDDHDVADVLPRRRPPSVSAIVLMLRAAQHDLGFEWYDLARYGLKLLQYLTSHPERRRTYEGKSWAEFVGVEGYSKQFKEALDIWPQALVGMRSNQCDARTAGNVTMQMLLDQLRPAGFRDGTLNASTSEAWLEHWRRYLESQGVRFHLGRLKRLRWGDHERRLLVEAETISGVDCNRGYVILALPAEKACEVVRDLRDGLPPYVRATYFAEGSDLDRLARFLDPHREDYHKGPVPDGPFQHFNGIQFYLLHDLSLVRGYTYYANSSWGLTSISQAQFLVERPDWRDHYRGIVSVDIGSWARDGQKHRKPAWGCSRDEVAQEIWYQIAKGIEDRSKATPMPVWYHIDDDMEWEPGPEGRPRRNRTPYLLTRPGEWDRRPGKRGRVGFAYQVSFDDGGDLKGLVLAGNYMKTFTRLGTMETANESARHAVNSLLMHWRDRMGEDARGRVPQWCRYWDPEDHELADLAPLREIDRKLLARRLPHFLEILQVERWLAAEWPVLAAAAPAPADALGDLLERILDLGRRGAPDWLGRIARSLQTGSALLGLLADRLREDQG